MMSPEIGWLLVRADASPWSGAGHVMRCIALAQSWIARGGEVTFVSDCQSKGLRQRIEASGAQLVLRPPLQSDTADLHELCTIAQQLRRQDPEQRPPWVVLDGYDFGPEYQRTLKSTGFPLLVIDDMAHHARYYASVLLNQNEGAEALPYAISGHTQCLFGPRYALLRSEFDRWSGWNPSVSARATNLLVSLGGSDPDNRTQTVIEAVGTLAEADLKVRVIVGAANPHREVLEIATKIDRNNRISIWHQVDDISEHMAWADLAISAGGSTCWELAYMGLPNLILVLAANQQGIANSLDAAGVSVNLGWHTEVQPSVLAQVLDALLRDPARRQAMSERGKAMVDGRGAQRLVETLCSKGSI
jgi:UDP-2,4-diacetamido-2,4,6-trideoxy-beta-L-altropyranose hydrolase